MTLLVLAFWIWVGALAFVVVAAGLLLLFRPFIEIHLFSWPSRFRSVPERRAALRCR